MFSIHHSTGVVYTDPGHIIASSSSNRLCHHTLLSEPKEGKATHVADPFLLFITPCLFAFATLSFQRVWVVLISLFLFHLPSWAGRIHTEHSSLSFIWIILNRAKLPAYNSYINGTQNVQVYYTSLAAAHVFLFRFYSVIHSPIRFVILFLFSFHFFFLLFYFIFLFCPSVT